LCKGIFGDKNFNQAEFDKYAQNGFIPKTKLQELYYISVPSHICLSVSQESESNTETANLLREELMKLGYEVYTPDKGSSVVPKLEGNNMKTITSSVEKASIVIICLSPYYTEDINCFALSNLARSYGSKKAYVQMQSKLPALAPWILDEMEEANTKIPFPAHDRQSAQNAAMSISKLVGNASKKSVPEVVTCTMSNGDVYTGTLVDSKKHGEGKCVYANPTGRIYEGDFFNDKRHGKGMCIYPNGDVYTGDFVDEKYKGKGVYKYAEGDIFWGCYDNGQRNGYGECKYASGDYYMGQFKDDMYSGYGKYRWSDGAVYEGEYFEDQMHGTGALTNPDGTIAHSGAWEMGDEA
jgi:hypothetical protein